MNKNFLSFFLCDAAEKTTAVILYTYITFQNTLCSVTVDFCAQSSWLKKLLQTIRPPLPLLPWLVSLDLVCPCSLYLQVMVFSLEQDLSVESIYDLDETIQVLVWLKIPTLVLAGSHSYYTVIIHKVLPPAHAVVNMVRYSHQVCLTCSYLNINQLNNHPVHLNIIHVGKYGGQVLCRLCTTPGVFSYHYHP